MTRRLSINRRTLPDLAIVVTGFLFIPFLVAIFLLGAVVVNPDADSVRLFLATIGVLSGTMASLLIATIAFLARDRFEEGRVSDILLWKNYDVYLLGVAVLDFLVLALVSLTFLAEMTSSTQITADKLTGYVTTTHLFFRFGVMFLLGGILWAVMYRATRNLLGGWNRGLEMSSGRRE